jgi:hypothetical protein
LLKVTNVEIMVHCVHCRAAINRPAKASPLRSEAGKPAFKAKQIHRQHTFGIGDRRISSNIIV